MVVVRRWPWNCRPAGPPRPQTSQAHPTTALSDGQTVAITGENVLGPDEHLSVYQCARPSAQTGSVCGEPAWGTADGQGNFQAALTVHRTLTDGQGTVDCTVEQCYLTAPGREIPISFLVVGGAD